MRLGLAAERGLQSPTGASLQIDNLMIEGLQMVSSARDVSIGDKFNRWTVVSEIINTGKGANSFNVVCDCGTEKTKTFSELNTGKSKSCGCLRDALRRQRLIKRYGFKAGDRCYNLTVISGEVFDDKSKGRPCLELLCDCGNKIIVTVNHFQGGAVKSCGCRRIKKSRERAIKRNTTHGNVGHPLFQTWYDMLRRCNDHRNGSYKNYGHRGIKVCKRWEKSFDAFVDDVGPRPSNGYTLDRINVDGHYEPENCRWATQKMQCRNTRRNIFFEINGSEKTLVEWCSIYNAKYQRVLDRVKKLGWTVEEALIRPVGYQYARSIKDTNTKKA